MPARVSLKTLVNLILWTGSTVQTEARGLLIGNVSSQQRYIKQNSSGIVKIIVNENKIKTIPFM